MKNFWQKLEKPIFCLAPMADVTDCAFRQIIAKYGKPDVFFTEFVSVDGLCSGGQDKLLIDLKYGENEHPIVAQIFGSKPENFEKVARMLVKMGFDGIDINMGCPVKKVLNQRSCSALIKTPELAKEIILATKRGAGEIPVSVKTRIGFTNTDELNIWIPHILEAEPAALTVHLRTVKEMSKVPAHWEMMKRIVEIRNVMSPHRRPAEKAGKTLIIGNGDVTGIDDAKRKCEETGCDGVMLGRAIFGNPWLFANLARAKHDCQIEHPASYSPKNKFQDLNENQAELFFATQSRNSAERSECVAINEPREYEAGVSLGERLRVLVEHTKLFEKMFMDTNPIRTNGRKRPTSNGAKNFAIMKKHFKAYANGFEGAKDLRMELMETENASQVEGIINDFLSKNS